VQLYERIDPAKVLDILRHHREDLADFLKLLLENEP
jgi:hypothetical protein